MNIQNIYLAFEHWFRLVYGVYHLFQQNFSLRSVYWWRKPEYPRENHRPVASHRQTLPHSVVWLRYIVFNATFIFYWFVWFGCMVFNATSNNYWWMQPEETTDLSQATDKLYHILLYLINMYCYIRVSYWFF